jgi:hypothetical protein
MDWGGFLVGLCCGISGCYFGAMVVLALRRCRRAP